jgi:putative methyltransferase
LQTGNSTFAKGDGPMTVLKSLSKQKIVMVDLGTGMGRELLPLSLGYVTSYARSIPEIEDAYDFHVHFLDRDLQTVIPGWDNPSVVAITFYGWHKNASLRLAEATKQLYPNCRIILGGPSVPSRPERIDEFMNSHSYVDYLVHGEGEATFAALLKALDDSRDVFAVEGITFRCPDVAAGYMTTTPRSQISDLNVIQSPFFNGFFDDIMERYGDRLTGAVFETNRGCPFSCTFCDWGSATMSKVRRFDLDRVLDEIEWIGRNKFFYLYCADANFGILFDRDLKIAKKIGELHRNTGYAGYLRICWTKNSSEKVTQISDVMRTNGVDTMVTLSMQSFHPETLDAIKRKNIKHDDLLKLKSKFNEIGLTTYTEVILGLPNETYETFRDGLSRTMTSRLQDLVSIYLCSMIENAEMATAESREKYGIETRFCYASSLRTAKFKFTDKKVGVSDGWAVSAEPREDTGVVDHDFGHRFAGLTQGDAFEVDEIVVGTSTMPVEDWRRSFIHAHVVWAMYFYRLAFFVMQYLHHEFGVEHREFLEHLVAEVTENRRQFPRTEKGIRHLETQADVILGSASVTLPVDGYGDRGFQPNEAVMTILLDDAGTFYSELATLTDRYCNKQGYDVQPDILNEVICYQKVRMPVFPKPAQASYLFEYNIPDYFDAITAQKDVPALTKMANNMEILIPDDFSDDRAQFALDRVDRGITLKLRNRVHPRPLQPLLGQQFVDGP